MLEQHDLEMITSIVCSAVQPLREDIGNLRADVTTLKEDVSVLKADVTTLKEDVSILKADVTTLKEDVSVLKADVSTLKADVIELKETDKRLEARIQMLQTVQEVEIIKGIKIIGEGHEILARKFDQALLEVQKDEMFKLRIWSLEQDFRKLNDKVDGRLAS